VQNYGILNCYDSGIQLCEPAPATANFYNSSIETLTTLTGPNVVNDFGSSYDFANFTNTTYNGPVTAFRTMPQHTSGTFVINNTGYTYTPLGLNGNDALVVTDGSGNVGTNVISASSLATNASGQIIAGAVAAGFVYNTGGEVVTGGSDILFDGTPTLVNGMTFSAPTFVVPTTGAYSISYSVLGQDSAGGNGQPSVGVAQNAVVVPGLSSFQIAPNPAYVTLSGSGVVSAVANDIFSLVNTNLTGDTLTLPAATLPISNAMFSVVQIA
jgi:hypothetical protein